MQAHRMILEDGVYLWAVVVNDCADRYNYNPRWHSAFIRPRRMHDLNHDPNLISRYELPSTQAFAEAPTFSFFIFPFSVFKLETEVRWQYLNHWNISNKPSLLKWENKVSRRWILEWRLFERLCPDNEEFSTLAAPHTISDSWAGGQA